MTAISVPDRIFRTAGLLVSVLIRAAPISLLAAAVPAAAQVGVVPMKPMQQSAAERWVPAQSSTSGCIDVARIGGAVFVDPRTVDVVMRGGARWRLTLAQQCTQLSYYGGFYYQPTQAGKFCAGRDRIIGRAGGSCRVAKITKMRKVTQKQ